MNYQKNSIKIKYPEHIKIEGANYIKLEDKYYPAYPSGRLKSQGDYDKIKENFININEIDENTLDGKNKLENFRRYNKGPLTGRIDDFFSSNQNSVSVGGRRKSKKTKRKSLKRGRKTRRKSLKKRKRTRRKSRRKVRR